MVKCQSKIKLLPSTMGFIRGVFFVNITLMIPIAVTKKTNPVVMDDEEINEPPFHDDGGNDGNGHERDRQTGILLKPRPKTKKPSMYKVLLLNDDYTPMEFVVHVLERFFNKNRQESTDIMLHVHRRGVGLCGIFTYEVAETKVAQVMDFARANEQPLQCTMEKE